MKILKVHFKQIRTNQQQNSSRKRWTMRVITAAAILLSTLGRSAACAASSPESELLEPIVKRHIGVLPESVCKELIALGDKEGFTVDEESIDDGEEYNVSSQSIEVFERDDGITSPAIWKALQPWIPQLTDLVKGSIDKSTDSMYYPDDPDRVPQLGWVFFRKYSPDTDRKSLKLHVDSNMHTLNIALNDDFEGGGLFWVKPPAHQEEEAPDGRPEIPLEYRNYDWLNNVKRENTSDLVFPTLKGGDVLIHNFTVWHAVAPIEVGTRYSFVLFYDMDNPAIQDDFNPDVPDDDDAFNVAFYHEIEDMEIDLAFVFDEEGEMEIDILEENMPPFEEVELDSYEGHMFRAFISGTDTVLSEFVMRDSQRLYTIEEKEAPNDEL